MEEENELFDFEEPYKVGILKKTSDIHMHDYQLGVLYTYRDIPGKANLNYSSDDAGFSIGKEYFFTKPVEVEDIKEKIDQGYKGCNAINKVKGGGKRCETCYDLFEVFNRENYNAKKWNKRITQPLNFLEKSCIEFRELTELDLDQAIKLHDDWVEFKLTQPGVFRNQFPRSRYKRCLISAVKKELDGLLAIGAFDGDTLISFRVEYIRGEYSYDLAYITDRNNKFATDFSEKFNILTLKKLKECYGVRFFNCGLSEGKLKDFKEHFPHYEEAYFRYTKSSFG